MTIKEIPNSDQLSLHASANLIDPVAAVKELIDNGIDSGSLKLTIEVDSKTGGCEYIEVKDKGPGVDPADRFLMCQNHYSSKINQLSDLSSLYTLGFRGDALYIIANLATQKGSMQIMTRTLTEKIGETWLLDSNGGIKNNEIQKYNCEVGTKVIVRNLLAGLHVRNLEYSKKSKNTIDRLKKMIDHYSLNFRNIQFQFYLVKLNRDSSISTRQIQQTLEMHLSRKRCLMILANVDRASIQLFIEKSNVKINDNVQLDLILPKKNLGIKSTSLSRKYRFLTVNNRPISLSLSFGKALTKTLHYAYEQENISKPMPWFLSLHIEPSLIDVNIEPEKNDIFLHNQQKLLIDFEFVIRSILHEISETSATDPSDVNITHHSQNSIKTISSHKPQSIFNELQYNNDIMVQNKENTNLPPLEISTISDKSELIELDPTEIENGLCINDMVMKKTTKIINSKPATIKHSKIDKPTTKRFSGSMIDNYLIHSAKFYPSNLRRVSRFSEFTNNLVMNSSIKIPTFNKNDYEDDINWLMRESMINESITEYLNKLIIPLYGRCVFKQSTNGWKECSSDNNI